MSSQAVLQPGTKLATIAAAERLCAHCGEPVTSRDVADRFCCSGCAGAHALIQGLGLEQYYSLRDKAGPANADGASGTDWQEFVEPLGDGRYRLGLMVGDLHCAACLWLIERALRAQPGVTRAQLSNATRRLTIEWRGAAAQGNDLAGMVARLGYRCLPLDGSDATEQAGAAEERGLLRAMGVAGFAAANIMLLSVSVWSGNVGEMEPATRDLFHGVSALIAIPAIAYAGLPFFRSAANALRHGHTNMDVPISIGVVLAALVSLAEFLRSGPHAYFDAAITLLFFLLVGRYLDLRARGFARRSAQQLLAWTNRPVTVRGAAGLCQRPAQKVAVGETVLVAAGERIGVDGIVLEGESAIDASLLTGESLPQPVQPGALVHAGAVNIDAPLALTVTATGGATLVGEMTRLLEAAEQGRSRYVRLAEQVSRWYAPVVHLTALLTFIGWLLLGDIAWRDALLIAATVLIITCPCALALAVPVVQVVASGRLMRAGILLKTATALERAAAIDTIVFDKTGTLTLGRPRLSPPAADGLALLPLAAGLAARSRHPLCRALLAACATPEHYDGVEEIPGQGLRLRRPEGEYRLGHARFAGAEAEAATSQDGRSELWLVRPGMAPVAFRFEDDLRPDAAAVLATLRGQGLHLTILSGDHAGAVNRVAETLGITDWQAGIDPRGKADAVAALKQQGRQVLMVGDGLNDAVALALADASLSPASGLAIAQNAADAVFQGEKLDAVGEFLAVARATQHLSLQNLGIALIYNLFAVPLAIAGFVTPLLAAIAMSSSSLLVVGNALRLDFSHRHRQGSAKP